MNVQKENISPYQDEYLYFSHMIDHPSPAEHRFHLHDYTEVFLFLSGDVDFLVSDSYISLEPGDILILKPNVMHMPMIKSDTLYERFYFGIPDGALKGMDGIRDPMSFLKSEQYLVKPGKTRGEQIVKLSWQIHDALEERQMDRDYLCFSWFLQILHLLNLSVREAPVEWMQTEAPRSELVNRVLQYLNDHVAETVSVRELSQIFHVNAAYLSSLFSAEVNVPLKQYMMVRRISRAKNLLAGGAGISETAYECGFSSASHFIAAFKKVTGKTPGLYQKAVL